jgi:processive 1,2-diacylglycerol beta-glucosyltransferase
MDGSPLRILLLTSSLGSGHLMASRALAIALRRTGYAIGIETVDVWSLIDPGVAAAVRRAYLDTIAAEPELYDAVYRLDEQTWRGLLDAERSLPPPLETFMEHFCARVARANGAVSDKVAGERHPSDRLLVHYLRASLARRRRNGPGTLVRPVLSRWIWGRLARRLEHRVREFRPHAAIATQMGPAALLASIKTRRGLALPLIAVPTDFGIHDAWLQRGIGYFCVAHESVPRPQLPAGSVLLATGMPLLPDFGHPPERDAARVELGLHTERPVVLVSGGGLGLGVADIGARILAEVPDAVVAVASSRNADARAALQALGPRHPDRLVDCGWTERMPAWLRAADVVVGKPGGLTVAESLACGRYMLAIHGPGGQEGFNVRFLEEHGAGALVRNEQLGERLRALLADPVRLGALQARAAALGRHDGARRIADLAIGAARASRHPALARVPA